MASIFKRKYRDKGGTERECRHYTIEYTTPAGQRKRAKGYTDRAATAQKAAKLERAVARGEEGLVDPHAGHRATPLLDHVRDYVADLRTLGRDDKYVSNADARLRLLAAECAWKTLGDVDANSFVRWREARATKVKGGQLGKAPSAETLNQHLETAQGFLNWCAKVGRVAGAQIGSRTFCLLLSGVTKVRGPKVRVRRALSDAQVGALLAAVPADRAVVYRLGLATGLRRQELADLKWGDVRLGAIRPYLALRDYATKARRADQVPLPATLVEELRAMRGDAKDSAVVFPAGVPGMGVWKADLATAGIPYKDDQGRQADFHGGTRKTLNTRLNRSGRAVVHTMRLMRVTDARLVTETYNDDEQLGAHEAALPEIPAAPKAPAKRAGAGTA